MRIVDAVERTGRVTIEVDGRRFDCFQGEVIATVLVLEQDGTARFDSAGAPRGLLCNMGVCSECMVWVQGEDLAWRRLRACLVPVRDGQRVRTWGPADD